MKPFYAFEPAFDRFAQAAKPLYICGQIFGFFSIADCIATPWMKTFCKSYTIAVQIITAIGQARASQMWLFDNLP